MSDRVPNIHPGEVLLEEFLRPLQLSQNALARELGVPTRRAAIVPGGGSKHLYREKRGFQSKSATPLSRRRLASIMALPAASISRSALG
jgi:hypothetical protein